MEDGIMRRSGIGGSGGPWWGSQRAVRTEAMGGTCSGTIETPLSHERGHRQNAPSGSKSFTHTNEGGGRVMRKLFAVVLIGGLLAAAGAGPAMAQGNADPLSLAASGVVIPIIQASTFTSFNDGVSRPFVALIEVASPVGLNDGRGGSNPLHLVFHNATCTRVASIGLPETTNDIGFIDASQIVPNLASGLVSIAGSINANTLVPLSNAIHARVYEFGTADGRSRVHEPIILDSSEFSAPATSYWSPLRTAATFYAPLETATVKTVITLICPNINIQDVQNNMIGQVFPTPLFPTILGTDVTAFSNTTTTLFGRVYDTNEILLRDWQIDCSCLTEISVIGMSPIYGLTPDPVTGTLGAFFGTYTEMEANNAAGSGAAKGVFTGYRSVSTTNSPNNSFFGRLSDGSRPFINGTILPNPPVPTGGPGTPALGGQR